MGTSSDNSSSSEEVFEENPDDYHMIDESPCMTSDTQMTLTSLRMSQIKMNHSPTMRGFDTELTLTRER